MFYLIVVACDNVGDKCYSPVFMKLDEVSLYLCATEIVFPAVSIDPVLLVRKF